MLVFILISSDNFRSCRSIEAPVEKIDFDAVRTCLLMLLMPTACPQLGRASRAYCKSNRFIPGHDKKILRNKRATRRVFIVPTQTLRSFFTQETL